jgi:hypothetical protein
MLRQQKNEIIARALKTVENVTIGYILGINDKSLAYGDKIETNIDTLAQKQKKVENQPTTGFIQITEYNKLESIYPIMVAVDENCIFLLVNLRKSYSYKTIAQVNGICREGMAWLKIECDANYDNSQFLIC